MDNLDEKKILENLGTLMQGANSPCIKCLEAARNSYAICIANAKTPAEKTTCLT